MVFIEYILNGYKQPDCLIVNFTVSGFEATNLRLLTQMIDMVWR
jgi:hypothetical protein